MTVKTNGEYLKTFESETDATGNTKKEYISKLNKLKEQVQFDADQKDLISFLKTVTNPNTQSNKAFALMRLRRHFKLPTDEMEEYREELKEEIIKHRKAQHKKNIESMIPYDQLLKELDELKGQDYCMNYMFCKHGVRNKDINVIMKDRKPRRIGQNTIVHNPTSKKPKAVYHIVDYKTSSTYGKKTITITDARFVTELRKIFKNNQYMFADRCGDKFSMTHMNVHVMKNSIRNYGEGRIAKIYLKYLIDTKQFDKVEQMSKDRSTALKTIYTSYNLYDSK